MHRVGFRRVLPIAFALIHLVLLWFTQTSQPHASPRIARRPAAYQGDLGVPIELLEPLEPPPLRPVQKIALLVELPAMFLATLIGAVLFPRSETAWMYLSIPLVSLVWYAIGRWLDGLLGYIVRLRLPETLRRLLAILASGALCLSMGGLTPLYHHRTADTHFNLPQHRHDLLWSVPL